MALAVIIQWIKERRSTKKGGIDFINVEEAFLGLPCFTPQKYRAVTSMVVQIANVM